MASALAPVEATKPRSDPNTGPQQDNGPTNRWLITRDLFCVFIVYLNINAASATIDRACICYISICFVSVYNLDVDMILLPILFFFKFTLKNQVLD